MVDILVRNVDAATAGQLKKKARRKSRSEGCIGWARSLSAISTKISSRA